MSTSPTTRAATGTARSARPGRRAPGWRPARPSCCPSAISTWSSPCRRRSPTSPTRTSAVYDLLMTASAETTLTIAADAKHLGARIGITSVLHAWGSAMTHHPHAHMIVPAAAVGGRVGMDRVPGELLPAGARAVAAVPAAVSRGAAKLHRAGRLAFFGEHAGLADSVRLQRLPRALREHRVGGLRQGAVRGPGGARLSQPLHPPRGDLEQPPDPAGADSVTFRVKDYRVDGPALQDHDAQATHEFIRRFLIARAPQGQHRIRHYGLFGNGGRAATSCPHPRVAGRAHPHPTPRTPTPRTPTPMTPTPRTPTLRRAACPRAPVSLLRRTPDHRRGVRTRTRTATSTGIPEASTAHDPATAPPARHERSESPPRLRSAVRHRRDRSIIRREKTMADPAFTATRPDAATRTGARQDRTSSDGRAAAALPGARPGDADSP